ncbi:MAG: hypothetical protein LBI15_09495 [Dysgonamonadaceae bacterium]|nr:hypothetical protein [Dysgonamonadaceae bacterium]
MKIIEYLLGLLGLSMVAWLLSYFSKLSFFHTLAFIVVWIGLLILVDIFVVKMLKRRNDGSAGFAILATIIAVGVATYMIYDSIIGAIAISVISLVTLGYHSPHKRYE